MIGKKKTITLFLFILSFFPAAVHSSEKESRSYIRKLYVRNDGSISDVERMKRSDSLSYELRKKAIYRTQKVLKKTKSESTKAILWSRLATLYEKQANAEEIFNLGNKSQYKEKIKKSIKIRKNLLKRYRKWIEVDFVLFYLAENYRILKDEQNSKKYFQEVVHNHKDSIFFADSLLALGNIEYKHKKFSSARSFYERILKLRNTYLFAYAHYKIAWTYFNEGKPKIAINSLIKAIKVSLKMRKAHKYRLDVEEEALHDLAIFYAEGEDPVKAREFFEKLATPEKAGKLCYMLAKRYYNHGKYKNAYIVMERLLKDRPPGMNVVEILTALLDISEKKKDVRI